MPPLSYSGYRFPRDIIQRAVWMYLRFTLSFRDVEELLAERGIVVTYEGLVTLGIFTCQGADRAQSGSRIFNGLERRTERRIREVPAWAKL